MYWKCWLKARKKLENSVSITNNEKFNGQTAWMLVFCVCHQSSKSWFLNPWQTLKNNLYSQRNRTSSLSKRINPIFACAQFAPLRHYHQWHGKPIRTHFITQRELRIDIIRIIRIIHIIRCNRVAHYIAFDCKRKTLPQREQTNEPTLRVTRHASMRSPTFVYVYAILLCINTVYSIQTVINISTGSNKYPSFVCINRKNTTDNDNIHFEWIIRSEYDDNMVLLL